jgi:hypothetical protein
LIPPGSREHTWKIVGCWSRERDVASWADAVATARAGGGIEATLSERWSAKVEYLYLDLGGIVQAMPDATGFVAYDQFSTTMHEHIFRVGVNYRVRDRPVCPTRLSKNSAFLEVGVRFGL